MVVEGKTPVRLHSAEEVLYSTIPVGWGLALPTVSTTVVGSIFEVAVFGSQLM